MTVKELMEKLKSFDENSKVYVFTYNFGNIRVLRVSSVDYDYDKEEKVNNDVLIFTY